NRTQESLRLYVCNENPKFVGVMANGRSLVSRMWPVFAHDSRYRTPDCRHFFVLSVGGTLLDGAQQPFDFGTLWGVGRHAGEELAGGGGGLAAAARPGIGEREVEPRFEEALVGANCGL